LKIPFYLLLYPSGPGNDLVLRLKKKLSGNQAYKNNSLNAPPHWTLCRFAVKAGQEQELLDQLDQLVPFIQGLTTRTSGISSFNSTGTLYVELKEKERCLALQLEIVQELKKRLPFLKRNMSTASVPHLTIIRGVRADLLEEIKKELEDSYEDSPCGFNSLSLLQEQSGKMKLLKRWNLIEK